MSQSVRSPPRQAVQARVLTHGECTATRASCRIKLLPVTHVLVDTWMLTVKLVYEFSDVPDDLKWTTNTHITPVHPYFCPSIFVFTHPNDGWTGLYIKL